MLILKLIQSLLKALNSDGTPGQVAAGITLGAALGLTPLLNLHNLLIFSLGVILNVSFPGVMLGWLAFAPVGFALDPLFDAVGRLLLVDATVLLPLWTAFYNTPVLALANLNNTVVLGSLISWMVGSVPLFFLLRWAVSRYRATVYERLRKTRLMRTVRASKIYNFYTMLRP